MPMPQPNLVPVRPMTSRMTHNSGVSSSTSIDTARPLMWNVVMLNNSERRSSLRGARPAVARIAAIFLSRSGQGGKFVRVRRR